VAAVIGSGIMAEWLAGGNVALALLANTVATGAILIVLIQVFGPISGAHFNPAVSVVFAARRKVDTTTLAIYLAGQLCGAVIGAMIAHAMFEQPALQLSVTQRSGIGQWLGEVVATFGLIGTILGVSHARPSGVAYAVGLYISAAYWFTSSTSFANPAVTIGRGLSDTFAGIALSNVPAFVLAQMSGALLAHGFFGWLLAGTPATEDA
jgi:glycerol uptake facilitator-like aquaporin